MLTEQPISASIVYRALPTIRVNGAEVPTARQLLTGMDMIEQQGGLSRIELRFHNILALDDNTVRLAFDDRTFEFGKLLTVYSGDDTSPTEIFRGFITGIESRFPADSAPEFIVLAEDELQRARFHRQTRFHEDFTLSSLATSLADNADLNVSAAPQTTCGSHMQFNESDLAFLRRVASRYDVDLQASAGQLQCDQPQNVRRAVVPLRLHSQLRSARVLADLSHQVTAVTVSGWDHSQGKKIKAESTGRNLGPGQGLPAAQIFRTSFGERKEHLSHLIAADQSEAEALATTAFDQRARRFLTLQAEAEGNPLIRVGTHTTIEGLGKLFDNTYYVTSTHHHFDLDLGYRTDFTAECAYLGNL